MLDEDFPAKTVSFSTVDSLQAVLAEIQARNKHFVLFLAVDATEISPGDISSIAKPLLKEGMIYVCVWGPDCERVHDTIDEVINKLNPDATDSDVVITTWHAKDSLEEAVWFFLNCTWPAAAYEKTCEDWIAVVINNAEWSERVKAELTSPHNT